MVDKIIQKRWFHGTTKENWEKIKREGVLWGINGNLRQTFLASNLKQLINMITDKNKIWNGDMHGFELILSIKYQSNKIDDSGLINGWEMIVKKPIPLSNVRFLRYI